MGNAVAPEPRPRIVSAADAASRPPVIRVDALTKRYAPGTYPAVEDLSLTVDSGEVMALLGPSGCGKTTFLRLLAGFEAPEAGRIEVNGTEVTGPERFVPPERRRLGFVFQDYALFPHLDVLHNVAFGLRGRARQRLARAREVLDLVGLTVFARRYPNQLSGGQQQRVALARALAPEPDVILLDEPFSNLDAALRGSTREEVRRILDRTGTTALLVTHDQEEALSFADRLAVMRAGRLEQAGAPEETYGHPRTAFVASFLGRTNLLHGEADGAVAHTALGDVPLVAPQRGPVLLSLRPEELTFCDEGGVPVTVTARAFKGHDLTFRCHRAASGTRGDEGALVVQTGPECDLRVGDEARLAVRGRGVALEASGD